MSETEDPTLGCTGVFWDTVDLPIPQTPFGIDGFRIHLKVVDSLEEKLIFGSLRIWLFAEEAIIDELADDSFNLVFVPASRDESERAKMMIQEILIFALDNNAWEHDNLIVVSDTISREPELVSVLKSLEFRNRNVLLVQSDEANKVNIPTLSLDWFFQTLLHDDDDDDDDDDDGDDNDHDDDHDDDDHDDDDHDDDDHDDDDDDDDDDHDDDDDDDDDIEADCIAYLTEVIAEQKKALRERRIALAKRKNALEKEKNAFIRGEVAKAKTGVFWDVSDCPLPEGFSDVRSLYFSIKYALVEEDKDHSGDMSVFTYGKRETLPSEYSVETPFSLGGNMVYRGAWDKAARVYKMMWDILIWAFDNRETGKNLVVILSWEDKEFVTTFAYTMFVGTLLQLNSRGYNVLLVRHEMDSPSEDLLGSVSTIWLWTSLLHHFNSAKDVEVLGMESLKIELQSMGLKCGGTLQERAQRLFLLKSTPLDMLPKQFLAKKGERREKK